MADNTKTSSPPTGHISSDYALPASTSTDSTSQPLITNRIIQRPNTFPLDDWALATLTNRVRRRLAPSTQDPPSWWESYFHPERIALTRSLLSAASASFSEQLQWDLRDMSSSLSKHHAAVASASAAEEARLASLYTASAQRESSRTRWLWNRIPDCTLSRAAAPTLAPARAAAPNLSHTGRDGFRSRRDPYTNLQSPVPVVRWGSWHWVVHCTTPCPDWLDTTMNFVGGLLLVSGVARNTRPSTIEADDWTPQLRSPYTRQPGRTARARVMQPQLHGFVTLPHSLAATLDGPPGFSPLPVHTQLEHAASPDWDADPRDLIRYRLPSGFINVFAALHAPYVAEDGPRMLRAVMAKLRIAAVCHADWNPVELLPWTRAHRELVEWAADTVVDAERLAEYLHLPGVQDELDDYNRAWDKVGFLDAYELLSVQQEAACPGLPVVEDSKTLAAVAGPFVSLVLAIVTLTAIGHYMILFYFAFDRQHSWRTSVVFGIALSVMFALALFIDENM